jgi:hypothetical protein
MSVDMAAPGTFVLVIVKGFVPPHDDTQFENHTGQHHASKL